MISREFFMRDPLTCSAELIGATLEWDGCSGIIVETEAYAKYEDEASHAFSRPSARQFMDEHEPGAAYVYLNYGVHWLFNVLVKGGSSDGFVLFRALQPQKGIPEMQARRGVKDVRQLCSGPGKLTQALNILGSDHGMDLCASPRRGFGERTREVEVITGVRIGISKSAHLPWRFLLKDSPYASAGVNTRRPAPSVRKRRLALAAEGSGKTIKARSLKHRSGL